MNMEMWQKILGILLILVVIIAVIYKNKFSKKDTISISKLDKSSSNCYKAMCSIRNTFDIRQDDKLYNKCTQKYIESITINRQILLEHLKNIDHYIEIHEDMDEDSKNFMLNFYNNLYSELDKLKYIDRKLLRTDNTLFEISHKVILEASRFTLNTYKSLIEGDKEQYKIVVNKFEELNRQYELRKEALKDLNNITIQELEAKYSSKELA